MRKKFLDQVSKIKDSLNNQPSLEEVQKLHKEIFHNIDDEKRDLMRLGFQEYETVETPTKDYYFDFTKRKFTFKHGREFKVLKFKDFKDYTINYDNPRKSSSLEYRGGAFKGALYGNALGKNILGKSAVKVGAVIGALAGTKLNLGGKVAVQVVIRFKPFNTTLTFTEVKSLEQYIPLLEMLDRVSEFDRRR